MTTPTAAPAAISDELFDYLWNSRHDLLYKAWVQLRYHRKRQRFFDLVDKGTKAFTLLLGATLFGSYVQPYVPWVGTAISGLGLLALVFGYGDRKQTHKELGERAAALIRSVERVSRADLTAQFVADWRAEFADLVGKAPPPLRWLTLICEHEQSTADGHPNHVKRPNWLCRRLAHVY